MIDIRKFLREIIEASGKSPKSVARAAGTSENYIYALLNGARKPGTEIFLKVIEVCGNPDIRDTQTLKVVDLEEGVRKQMGLFATVVRKTGGQFQKGDIVTVKCPAGILQENDVVVFMNGNHCDFMKYHKLSKGALLTDDKRKIEVADDDKRIVCRVTELKRDLG